MYIIGISAYYHDSSVCLFRNGELVFACEEEKFTGIKHDQSFPRQSLNYILKRFKIKYDDVTAVCFYEDIDLKSNRVKDYFIKNIFKSPIHSIKSLYEIRKNKSNLLKELKKVSKNVYFCKHHESHLYYSAFSSPFKESLVLSIDGVGEYDTATLGVYDGKGIKIETLGTYPNSIGLFYSAITAFLGFKPNEGEYKVMGLSSYGDPKKYIKKLREIITYVDGEIICDMKYFNWDKSGKTMFTYELSKFLKLSPRIPDSDIDQNHKDLSASLQLRYEEILFSILKQIHNKYRIKNICLGGGCAYNGLANGKIYNKTGFEHVWIPPAPSDAGSSIGSCIKYMVDNNIKIKITENAFLGPSYTVDERIRPYLKGLKFYEAKDQFIYKLISKELKSGKVVAWFKDEIEFGARALGNRSILADPTVVGMKDRINRLVKKREGFRPFAPMVTSERQDEFFWINDDIPFMNQVVMVKEQYRNILNAVTHVDGTARVQTVYRGNRIHPLLREFETLTGIPILLNTSFNVKDKTMVLTPLQAIETLKETDIDILVLENYVIYNKK